MIGLSLAAWALAVGALSSMASATGVDERADLSKERCEPRRDDRPTIAPARPPLRAGDPQGAKPTKLPAATLEPLRPACPTPAQRWMPGLL